MAAAAPSSAGLSLWAGFVEESLILPGRNPGLFLRAVALIFAHTFVFLSLAVRSAHPAAAALLSLTATGAPPPPSWSRYALLEDDEGDYYPEATSGKVLYHGKTLLLFYLAYVGSKLATQAAVALAASATARFPGRPLVVIVVRGPRLLATAAFLAAAELASTALLAACVAAWWWACSGNGAVASFVSGVLLFVLLLGALARLCLAAAVPVAIAATAASSSEPEVGGGGASDLRRAWRLMSARKQEAAVLVGAASLLPLVVYPVYAIALVWGPGDSVWELLGMLPGYLFPSVTVQLYSAVAAAVFYHRFSHHAAIPFTTTKAILI
ncbi:uncharacterized protein LOC104583369 [Brachypodium distachyon]|uniref:Uncharacterized protein n=1 Tax=Brachypodium distachyon TaxID=15368 RepID=I1HUU6_BRADI|nr:uncharacterized protein LOC104583369 [Brachypodium distachyon]KQK11341.1 hypothetical protein BRADI_2g59600v3 [Brachypodium distachyon]|eukprot:XP_010233590.1 uncharacterized protein LOC104583369 [Brachypodium distachyon]